MVAATAPGSTITATTVTATTDNAEPLLVAFENVLCSDPAESLGVLIAHCIGPWRWKMLENYVDGGVEDLTNKKCPATRAWKTWRLGCDRSTNRVASHAYGSLLNQRNVELQTNWPLLWQLVHPVECGVADSPDSHMAACSPSRMWGHR